MPRLLARGVACDPLRTFVTSTRAKGGGPPPTEVKEEGRAQPEPGDMEWEGARRPWPARSRHANPEPAISVCIGPIAATAETAS
jgi:hypothetical protein